MNLHDTQSSEGAAYLSVTEVAAFFSVSQGTVRNWVKSGILPALKLPGGRGVVRIAASDVEELARRFSIQVSSEPQDPTFPVFDKDAELGEV